MLISTIRIVYIADIIFTFICYKIEINYPIIPVFFFYQKAPL